MTCEEFFADMEFRVVGNAWKAYPINKLSYMEVSDVHKLYYVSKGRAEWVIMDRHYTPGPLSLLLVPANTPVWFRTKTPIRIEYFTFRAKYNRNSIFDYIECPLLVNFTETEIKEIKDLFAQAEPDHENTVLSEALRQKAVVLRVLGMYFTKGNAVFRDYPQHGNDVVERIVQYINKSPERSFSLKDFSELTHVHTSYISRLFKQKLGISPIKYANAVRLKKIMEMVGSGCRFAEIAERFNFSSGEAFSRFVKTNTGLPPAEHRRRMRTENADG